MRFHPKIEKEISCIRTCILIESDVFLHDFKSNKIEFYAFLRAFS